MEVKAKGVTWSEGLGDASNNTVINKKLPIAAEVGRHQVAK